MLGAVFLTAWTLLLSCRGIDSIARMTSLKYIALHDCNSITNNGITALSSLTRLDKLSLRGCRKLTNSGMTVIQVSAQQLPSFSLLSPQV